MSALPERVQEFLSGRETGPDVVRLEATSGWVSLRLDELWRFRELLFFLVWRDIKVRYKQTVLGGSWAVIQPFMTMVVFSIFFGGMGGLESDNIPYPIFSYAGLVPWYFFSNGVTKSANSLVGGANMLKKVYFPRLAMPIASVLAGVFDFVLSFSLLLVMMVYYGTYPTGNIVWLPFLLLLTLITALGVGFWLSALNVQFRDVRHTTSFLTQFWLFATPIAYSSSMLGEPWRTLYALNPMAGVVEGFRWALLGTETQPGPMIIVSSVVSVALFVGGAFYFRRMERTFADVA